MSNKPKREKPLLITYNDGTTRRFESCTAFCRDIDALPSTLSVVMLKGKVPFKWQALHKISSIQFI